MLGSHVSIPQLWQKYVVFFEHVNSHKLIVPHFTLEFGRKWTILLACDKCSRNAWTRIFTLFQNVLQYFDIYLKFGKRVYIKVNHLSWNHWIESNKTHVYYRSIKFQYESRYMTVEYLREITVDRFFMNYPNEGLFSPNALTLSHMEMLDRLQLYLIREILVCWYRF